jgi:hypothetical protein
MNDDNEPPTRPDTLKARLEASIESVRRLPPMTQHQRQEQTLDFAYGNLALSTNHRPIKSAFEHIAKALGWTEEEFALWATGRKWQD